MLPPCRPGPAEIHPPLFGFLTASSPEEADRALARLMERADPLIAGCLERRGRGGTRADTEDAISEARTQLVQRLQNLRTAHGQPAALKEPTPAILDFDAYAVTVACNAWVQHVRRRNPARAMLLNQLRYLCEGRTNQRGFAVWKRAGGEAWAGFEVWRDRSATDSMPPGEKRGRLLADPRAAATEIFGPGDMAASLPLAELVGALFAWLGEPLRLRDLTDAVAEWRGVRAGRGEALVIDGGEFSHDLPSSGEPSPHDDLRWKEYLRWLGREAARLTLRQRTAFLLHSSCLREMEMLGLTDVRRAAALLEIPPLQMAAHWANLPLEDRVIGAILGAETQQIINLRKMARGILGRAWQRFLDEN